MKLTTEEALKFAKEDKEIPLDELTTDVYVDCREEKIRGIHPWKSLEHKMLSKPKNAD